MIQKNPSRVVFIIGTICGFAGVCRSAIMCPTWMWLDVIATAAIIGIWMALEAEGWR